MGFVFGGRPKVQWSSATANIICCGDSLTAGSGAAAGFDFPSQMAALAPLNGNVTVTNLGSAGTKLSDWTASLGGSLAASVDAAYNSSKKYNVIISLMGTNSIYAGGLTGLQTAAQYVSFCSERLAAHPDYIIVPVTMIARQGAGSFGTIDAANAELTALDNYLRTNYRAMGCKGVAWVRQPGSPLILPDYSTASFENAPYINYEALAEIGNHVHMNALGYSVIAQYVANVLKYLPSR